MTATDHLIINGEQISKYEAMDLVRMLCNDAKQIAGEFHNMNRSDKFRRNWPDEKVYAEANWKTFMEAARTLYAQRLGDPKTPAHEARKMHLALVLEHMTRQGVETDNRIQLRPNTQQFEGDPFENRKIVDQFGRQSNTFKELLLSSTTARYH